MNLDPNLLELDTQTELLERLSLLTGFGSNLITISGPVGAGKTWLSQRYLEIFASDKNQALLLCHPTQDDSQRRVQLISQLVQEAFFDPNASFVESLTELVGDEACDLALVIDDAHLLSETLVSELWMLVLEAQTRPNWTINVLLFAQPGALEALLTRLGYGQEHKPIDFEIEPLTQEESDRFFELLVIRYIDEDMEKRVRHVYKKTDCRPGEIMALTEHKAEKRIIIRSIVGTPMNIALLVLVLLLVIVGGYWWWSTQPTPEQRAQELSSVVEQTVIPTLEESSKAEMALNQDIISDQSQSMKADDQQIELDINNDASALPPLVTADTATLEAVADDQQRVVITSEVVDALLDDKPETVDTSNIEALVDSAEQTVVAEELQPAVAETQTELVLADSAEAVNVETSVDVSPAPPEVQFSFTREQLKALSARSYTLQLAAVQSLEEVQSFLNRYQLQQDIYVYPTVRNGREWFIVTYSNFATIQVARDAVADLPSEVQELEPWAKSLNQVHREIDRGI